MHFCRFVLAIDKKHVVISLTSSVLFVDKMKNTCYHCGDAILGKVIRRDEHDFCCLGCHTVYSLLQGNNLGDFYKFEQSAGTKPQNFNNGTYDFLELDEIRQKIVLYEDQTNCKVLLYLPSIHCSSCIYLLENINRLESAVTHCMVNFASREASITFDPSRLKLSELASLLHKIGYAPNFGNRKKTQSSINKQFLIKLGIAGFAFGSIMLWSFPEYLGIEEVNPEFRYFMSYLSLLVSIPVLLYSGNEFLISAWRAIRAKSINLDVPISIGILALYLQSAYTILSGGGAGYMDSFASFIFLLLIGKWFQNKTYQSLNFERDYTSYFPIAVTKLTNNTQIITAIENLQIGDTILIRNQEIVPCDAKLLNEEVTMDYSFVTGESDLLLKQRNATIFAGGKIIGKTARLEVVSSINRSHLTSLWNSSSPKQLSSLFPNAVSKWFLIGVLTISFIATVAWWFIDPTRIIEVVVAVLIVACPCALALSAPFTYGNSMRLLGRHGLYLKHVSVVKDLESVTDIVFDKTGTLTKVSRSVEYQGLELSLTEQSIILEMASSSTHPYSQALKNYLLELVSDQQSDVELHKFEEIKGKGMRGTYENIEITLGSADFLSIEPKDQQSSIYIEIKGLFYGRFIFHSQLREGIQQMIQHLTDYQLHVLSGDSEKDRNLISTTFQNNAKIIFHQTPLFKKKYIEQLKKSRKKVLMIGDGLNDSGALQEAQVGISITENLFQFTPSSDAILSANNLVSLSRLLKIAKFSRTTLTICFIFSILYNTIGLSFALSGLLEPIVAAIIMPLSSITIVAISTLTSLLTK